MFPFTVIDIILGMAACLFVMGIICIGAGVFLLVSKVLGDEIKLIAQQTSQLAQKGIAEDVSGLVGNASSLIDALNQLARTASGVGIFLVLMGFVQVIAAYLVVAQIQLLRGGPVEFADTVEAVDCRRRGTHAPGHSVAGIIALVPCPVAKGILT